MDPVIRTVLERETLDAFVDGALTPEESARVVMHLADCPGDAAYVDMVMEANALLAAAFAGPLTEPLPERIRAAIYPATSPAPERPLHRAAARPAARARNPRRMLGVAGAACAALALAVLAPRLLAPQAGGEDAATLAHALETAPSGPVATADGEAQLTLVASFRAADARPCRQYERIDARAATLTEGLACREADGSWRTELEVTNRLATAEDRGGAFVPAEGGEAGALDAALDRIGAGMILSPDEEAALVASGWAR